MQLYALEDNQEITHAAHAKKHENYTCIECGQKVHVRSGFHRQPHFYHLLPNRACRLNAKSMAHIMLQNHLKSILPEGEATLECRFPSINRIADVAWGRQKLIFEIQCSFIAATEVNQRNNDYRSQGYQTVWILHQSRYNQLRLTAAEHILRTHPHYFTNMDGTGNGNIYDQPSLAINGIRRCRLSKLPVNLSCPHTYTTEAPVLQLPLTLLNRLKKAPLYFHGDYIYSCLNGDFSTAEAVESLTHLFNAEAKYFKSSRDNFFDQPLMDFVKSLYIRSIALPYRALLRLGLERACR